MELIPVFSDLESRELDSFTIQELGIPGNVLMGMAASSLFQEYYDQMKAKEIIIVSGSGNNGGDGLALGLLLHCSGENVKIFRKEGKHSEEYLFYLQKAQNVGVSIQDIKAFYDYKPSESNKIVLIDCLLGTGFHPPLSEEILTIIRYINSIYKKENVVILSVDALSGFNLEEENPEFIESEILAEIGVKKESNLYASCFVKTMSFHPIAFPLDLFFKRTPIKDKIFSFRKKEEIQNKRERRFDSHKYSNGLACFVGGSYGMEGAILLAQKSFHSSGGGYSQVFSPSPEIKAIGLKTDPSLIYHSFHSISPENGIWDKASAIVIGPGLKKEDFTYDIDFFLERKAYLVLDAGAISLVKKQILNEKTILTPHRGEFQELIRKKLKTEKEFISELKKTAINKKTYILLKGHISILSNPNGELYFFPFSNPKLAVMGTGDLLCGIMAFFLGKNTNIESAVLDSLSYLNFSQDMKNQSPTAEEIRRFLES